MVYVREKKQRYNHKQPKPKKECDRIFTLPEVKPFEIWCNMKYEETGDGAYLACLFSMYEGTRCGEVCALDFADIDFVYKEINIWQMYVEDENGNYYLADHVKKFHARHVKMFDGALKIINKLPHRSGRLFVRPDGSFCNTDIINNVLEAYARETGAPVRRSHCLRRTFASCLDYYGVPREEIRKYLGHEKIEQTNAYIYSFNPQAEIVGDPFSVCH